MKKTQITEKTITQGERVLIFLYTYSIDHSYYPNCREISEAVGRHSTSAAHYYLMQLERKGFVKRALNIPRGTVLTKQGRLKVFELLGMKNVCECCGQALPSEELLVALPA